MRRYAVSISPDPASAAGNRSAASAQAGRIRLARVLAAALLAAILSLCFLRPDAHAGVEDLQQEWPATDFSRHSVAYSDIVSGDARMAAVPPLEHPSFMPAAKIRGLAAREPVISLQIGGVARAYPLRILVWHQIVNDVVDGVPIAVTWCPLCNSTVVFDRRLGERVLTFGITGKLHLSNLVMYDRETRSWWQQFVGNAIVGELLGSQLEIVSSRVESLARFRLRYPHGEVLLEPLPGGHQYGRNPYVGYESAQRPPFYDGPLPPGVAPLERVVVVGARAWTLELVRSKRKIERGDLVITWGPGQSSALDAVSTALGRDIGNIVVQRRTSAGLVDVPYNVSFAFAFHAFNRQAPIHRQ